MDDEEFDEAFRKEFPDLEYLFDERDKKYPNDGTISKAPFIQFLVEDALRLVDAGSSNYGFDGTKYSEEDSAKGRPQYHDANNYTFEFLKKNKHMLEFWLL